MGKPQKKILEKISIVLAIILIIFVLQAQTTTSSASSGKIVRISSSYVEPKSDTIYYKGKIVVTIEADKIGLKTEEMYVKKINNKWRLVEVPVKGEFTFDGGDAIADKMTYDMDLRNGTMNGAIVNILDEQSKEKIKIVADVLNYDLANELYSGTKKGGVIITKGKITAVADSFKYDKKKGELVLTGAVAITDDEKGVKMTASEATIYTEKNDMKAKDANIEIKLD